MRERAVIFPDNIFRLEAWCEGQQIVTLNSKPLGMTLDNKDGLAVLSWLKCSFPELKSNIINNEYEEKLDDLREQVKNLEEENEDLEAEVSDLKDDVVRLKENLEERDCPSTANY